MNQICLPKVNFKPDYLPQSLAQVMFQLFLVGQPEIDIALKLSDVLYEETEEAKYKVGLVCAIFKWGHCSLNITATQSLWFYGFIWIIVTCIYFYQNLPVSFNCRESDES